MNDEGEVSAESVSATERNAEPPKRTAAPDNGGTERRLFARHGRERPVRELRVAMVFPELLLRGGIRRGLILTRELVERGHAVAATSPGGPLERNFARVGSRSFLWAPKAPGASAGPFESTALAGEVRNWEPDILHVNTLAWPTPWIKLAARLRRPTVATIHSALEARALTRRHLRWLHGLIAVSHEVRETLVNVTGVARGHIHLIPPGIPIASEEEVRKRKTGMADHIPVAGCYGPLVYEEPLLVLLEACRLLVERGVEMRLLIIGDGKAAPAVRAWIDAHHMGRWIILVTELYDYDSPFQSVDVVVSTDESQDSTFFALEAMGRGVPVVLAGRGSNFELIEDEKTGLLYAPENAGALATRLQLVFSRPELRSSLGREGWEAVRRRFDVATMVAATERAYLACMDTREW